MDKTNSSELSYNRELIVKLLKDNPTLNNVEISKLYNIHDRKDFNTETFRKVIKRVRSEEGIANVFNKHTSKAYVKNDNYSYQEHNETSNTYRWSKVNLEKGTLESQVIVSFEPRNHEELAKLHNVDLSIYKISNYWSKLQPDGKFTSSLLCSLKKLGDAVSLTDIKDAFTETLKTAPYERVKIKKDKNTYGKTLILWVSDEHVGACVSGSIYENDYDRNIYFKRKMTLLDTVDEQFKINGKFDNIIVCSLGDNLDGNKGKTTRTLIGAHGHDLPQNMTNEEAIKTFVEVNKSFYNELVKMNATKKITLYNINNSNHGGLGFDFSANYALENYLSAVYGDLFEIVQIKDIYKAVDLYSYKLVLTHGKDEETMKRNLPLTLTPSIEGYLNEYLESVGKNKENYKNIVVKGDLHQYSGQLGRFFYYQNIPSLFGTSAWIHSNFGKGNAGYCYSLVNEDNNNGISFNPVWVK